MHFHATERQKKARLTDRHLPAASRSLAHQYLCVATIAMVPLYRDSSKKVGAGARVRHVRSPCTMRLLT